MPVVLARWYRGRASLQSGALTGALRQRATKQRRAIGRTRSVQSLLTGLPRQVHAAGGSAALNRRDQDKTHRTRETKMNRKRLTATIALLAGLLTSTALRAKDPNASALVPGALPLGEGILVNGAPMEPPIQVPVGAHGAADPGSG